MTSLLHYRSICLLPRIEIPNFNIVLLFIPSGFICSTQGVNIVCTEIKIQLPKYKIFRKYSYLCLPVYVECVFSRVKGCTYTKQSVMSQFTSQEQLNRA